MAGEENLIPFTELTEEEQRELARKGGIASGKARRQKKTMRENLEILLGMVLKPGTEANIEDIQSFADLKGKNITVEQAMLIAQIQKALKGDTPALAFLRDTSGQKPVDEVQASRDDEELEEEISYSKILSEELTKRRIEGVDD